MTEELSTPERPRSIEGFRAWLVAGFASLATAVAILVPFFWLGTASGHDIQFHISSWIDAANQWKEGILFPRWTEWANYGFGEPRFIFYPPLSWMLGAGLGSVFPWSWVPPVFVLVVQTFAGISAFALTRKFANSLSGALLGAVVYVANPYALLVIYLRSDYAELLATSFYPLLLLFALRLSGIAESDTRSRRNFVWFSVLFAAVWLSNAPAGVLASYSLALLFFSAAFSQKSLWPGLRGASGLTVGFGLTGFYLIPAAYEQRWVNITGALASGLTPADNFLFAKTTDAEHDAFNWIASAIAVLIIGWVVVAAIAFWRNTVKRGTERNRTVFYCMIAISGAACLLMTRITLPFWSHLPKLQFVQFPWRWMAVQAIVFALFTAAAATKRAILPWMAAILILAGSGGYLVKHAWWDSEDANFVQEAISEGRGVEGTDEYDPLGDDHTDIPQQQSQASLITDDEADPLPTGDVHVVRWTAEERVVEVQAPHAAVLRLRLLHHPAWAVTINGKPAQTGRTASYDAILVYLPAGESRIEARFTRTLDRTLGGWLSVISAAIAVMMLWFSKQRTA